MEELSELFSKGQRLGKYQLIRRLAVGGMAEIYLAQASGLEGFEKLVVLKRILPQHALDPQLRRMFLDEARLMATLTHPHITQVYDVGSEGDAPFFAMEYVHGANLREIMNAAGRAAGHDRQTTELPLHHAIGILAAAAAGLHYAHQQTGAKGEPLHIVHRDVSPSNVLVTYGGSVKVSDFGIAKWSSQRTQTQEGALKGKFAYMSPEQCRGVPLDRRSDVFALGTLLYELTTGKPPFRAVSDYEILNRIVNGELPAPEMPDGDTPYPADLERIVRRALAPAPDDRYPTAQALQLELEAFARGHGLVLSTVGLGEFMHTLFAQRLDDWQRAQQSGKSLKQHLAEVEAASARLEQSSQPTADLHVPPQDRARRRPSRRTPALVAVLTIVAAAGVVTALKSPFGAHRDPNGDPTAAAPVEGRPRSSPPRPMTTNTTSNATTNTTTNTTILAGTQSLTPALARGDAGAGRLSTAARPGNTVESHFESPSVTTNTARRKRAFRSRPAGQAIEPGEAGQAGETAVQRVAAPAPAAASAPVPAASDPDPTPRNGAARANALKTWDPDSPIPP